MSKFDVKVGKAEKTSKPTTSADGGLKAPRERKVIHPGIENMSNPSTARCRKCGDYFDWKPSGVGILLAGACQCGIWFFHQEKLLVRWVRWSSMPFYPGESQIFAPER
jgi:hypothetical protein